MYAWCSFKYEMIKFDQNITLQHKILSEEELKQYLTEKHIARDKKQRNKIEKLQDEVNLLQVENNELNNKRFKWFR